MRFCSTHNLICAVVISFTIVLALGLSGLPVSAAPETAIMTVSATTQAVSPGAQVTVNIVMQPNNSIAGTQFNLSFNPAMVTVNSVSEGNLLKQDGAGTYFSPGQIDNNAGTIIGVAGAIVDPGKTIITPGTFAVVTLTAGSTVGTCLLTLSKVIAGDINALSMPVATVNGNIIIGNSVDQPPVLNSIGNKTVKAGLILTFTVSAIDPDGASLTYSASNLPPGANFDPLSRAFSWTPTTNQTGLYPDVQFEVTDGTLSDSEIITITVASSSSSGGGGGGGGSKTSSTPPVTSYNIDNDGVFNQTAKVKSTDSMAEVVVDQGTKGLTKDGKAIDNITITAIQSPAPEQEQSMIVGTIYSIGPNGATFDQPVNLVFTYNPSLIPQGSEENNLVVATWDTASSHWTDLASTVNANNRTITARVNHFSIFAVLAPDKKPHAANFVISKLSLSNPEVKIGEMVTASALITNTGNASGVYNIILKINGNIEEEKNITLDTGVGQEVSFDIREDVPGTYTIDLNGLSLPLVVKESILAAITSPIPNASEGVDNATPFKAEEPPPATIISPGTNVKIFSLSLLAEIISVAFILIVATVSVILICRRKLHKRVHNQNIDVY
jgi:hypothetical protein